MNISSQLRSIPLLSLTLAGVVGCIVPESVGDAPDDTNVTATTEVMLGSTGMSSSSDSPDGTSTRAAGTSTGDPDPSTGSDSADPAASVCDPQPQEVIAVGMLADGDPLGPERPVFDATCEVLVADATNGAFEIELDCQSELVSFALSTSDPGLTLPLLVGEIVRVRLLEVVTIDSGYYLQLAISGPDGLLRLGYVTYPLGPDTLIAFEQWFAPLQLQVVEDVCDPEPYEPPTMGRVFIQIPCSYQHERLALDVSFEGGAPQRVFDSTRETVEGFDVWASTVLKLYPQDEQCETTEPSLFTTVLVLGPG
ncbi:MAG: hypothetical protein AB1Z98_06080 [Nannocystaceae bacterium]